MGGERKVKTDKKGRLISARARHRSDRAMIARAMRRAEAITKLRGRHGEAILGEALWWVADAIYDEIARLGESGDNRRLAVVTCAAGWFGHYIEKGWKDLGLSPLRKTRV